MTLVETLQAIEEKLDTLLELLKQEQSLLMQAEVDGNGLEQLAGAKQEAFRSLEQLDTSRREALQLSGFGPSRRETEAAAIAAGCQSQWERLQELQRETAQLNRLNGSLITQRMRYNQRVLDDLRRLAGNPLYSPDGQARSNQTRLQTRA